MKEVILDNYTGNGTYVAIRLQRNPSLIANYFIDDLLLEPLPTCPAVEFLTKVGNDSTMLTLTWVDTGSATSWQIEYGLSGFTPGTGTLVTATAVPFNITGLTPATHYDVYVTPVCPQGNALTRMATFLTANRSVELPFFCDFEDTIQNALWSLENGANSNKWCIGTATNYGGINSLYVTGDNGVSNSYTVGAADAVDYAFIDVVIPTPGEYGYSFDWKCNGERTNDYMRVALIPTHPHDNGDLRYAVSIDGNDEKVVSIKEPYRSAQWKKNVLRGQAVKNICIKLTKGEHTLTIRALDEGIILDQWMIDFNRHRKHYLFPID